MKKIFFVMVMMVFGLAVQSFAAEYRVQKGDVLGVVVKNLGQPMIECLKYANNLKDDVIIAGSVLYYPDAEDIERAKSFVWSYALGIAQKDQYEKEEYARFMKLHEYLEAGKIRCSDAQEGIHPMEVVVFSEAEMAY